MPFVSKATGVPLAKVAARVMLGQTLKEQGVVGRRYVPHLAVKEAVLPFVKFHGVDIILGPEMKSTGEVMGLSVQFGTAFAKAEAGAWCPLPNPKAVGETKKVFMSVNDRDKPKALSIARDLKQLGFNLICTSGTWAYLQEHGIEAERTFKVSEGRPNILDSFVNEEICLVINTPRKAISHQDEVALRRAALERNITYMTTMAASRAAVDGLRSILENPVSVKSLQQYQAETSFLDR